MKAIIEINGHHLLAPSAEAAMKVVSLLAKCQPMVQTWASRAHETTYHAAEPGEFERRFSVNVGLVNDDQVVKRIPTARRLAAPNPITSETCPS